MDLTLERKIRTGEQITYQYLENLSQHIVEFACTGNSGRSPLAEAFANDLILKYGLRDSHLTISSGTKRKAVLEDDPHIDFKLKIMKISLERGDVFSKELAKEAEAIVKNSVYVSLIQSQDNFSAKQYVDAIYILNTVDTLFKESMNYLMNEEHSFRAKAAKEFNLGIPIKQDGQQTQVCNQVNQIYALGDSNKADVERIYRDNAHQTEIYSLGIENTFAKPFDVYMEMTIDLRRKVSDIFETVVQEVR
ncbi:hypothetical protein HQ533_00800 [Candidatus Woesearchaeota archaeon]|nr:hypothetical protein [Candidatus Woesearchaeota archaeon]